LLGPAPGPDSQTSSHAWARRREGDTSVRTVRGARLVVELVDFRTREIIDPADFLKTKRQHCC
jgi:hypothetical protein